MPRTEPFLVDIPEAPEVGYPVTVTPSAYGLYDAEAKVNGATVRATIGFYGRRWEMVLEDRPGDTQHATLRDAAQALGREAIERSRLEAAVKASGIAPLTGPIEPQPAVFDGYEVALAVEVTDAHGDSYTERVEDPATLREMVAEGSPLLLMFTVYGHFETGGVEAFSDFVVADDGSVTYEQARQHALSLAQSIDAGRTTHGILDLTFDQPAVMTD